MRMPICFTWELGSPWARKDSDPWKVLWTAEASRMFVSSSIHFVHNSDSYVLIDGTDPVERPYDPRPYDSRYYRGRYDDYPPSRSRRGPGGGGGGYEDDYNRRDYDRGGYRDRDMGGREMRDRGEGREARGGGGGGGDYERGYERGGGGGGAGGGYERRYEDRSRY